MAPITVINQIRYTNSAVHGLVNIALKAIGETLLTTQTARDLLFGYEDKFLKVLSTLDKKLVPSDVVGLFIGVCSIFLFITYFTSFFIFLF